MRKEMNEIECIKNETDLEEQDILDICNVEMYLQNEIKPEITLTVQGKQISFLCDTGACKTLIHPQDLPEGIKKEGTIFVKSASGLICEEDVSEKLLVEDPQTKRKTECKIVISKRCPINFGQGLAACA